MMNSDTNKLLLGEFEPDKRAMDLHSQLELYYKKDTYMAWRDFRVWCIQNGYTQEEIRMAKMSVREPI